MGKIKTWYRSIPIWLTIFLFAAAAVIVCTLVSNRIVSMANRELGQIGMKYIFMSDDPTEDGGVTYHSVPGEEGMLVAYDITMHLMTKEDAQKYELYQSISQYTPAVIYSVGLLAAVLLVYFSKLKKPESSRISFCWTLICRMWTGSRSAAAYALL